MIEKKRILGAALGQCVHVAGLDHFLRLCERHGWISTLLGPAVPPSTLLEIVERDKPELVAVSYRLTPEDAAPLLTQLEEGARRLSFSPRWVFGGTPPVANKARACGLFERVFDGTESLPEIVAYIRGESAGSTDEDYAQGLVSRIEASAPFPLIRHHYGEPNLERTIEGARKIAEARVLDVLSIGQDQNAQESLFRPEEIDPEQDGAGGVPIRRAKDLEAIYQATRCGNFPLLRCYSGTRDLLQWAEMAIRTVNIAWGAVPLCWYSVMDGRSKIPFPQAIAEKQAAMRFYAEHGVPVEVNESHQWSLRDAHDSLAVTMAFLAAYNARKQGVRQYVIQMMHNTPPSISPAMDLAKMLAKLELIIEIEGPDFTTYREVRAGITSLPRDPDEAKGHMAASAVFSMAVRPHILHVVGYSEAHDVVNADILIESCRIARGAVALALQGSPDPARDPKVQARKKHLIREARTLLEGIRSLGNDLDDPWSDAEVLTRAIQAGLLDAPHFRGNPHLCGKILTACVNGGWEAIHPKTRRPLREKSRLARLGIR
ncbi:MAG: cobalamin-dependent protein [Candidatus Hydrogenedentes bacterium]|nr:cobalamin-dependent protein [Candidatus Hydrogenedentota bacterium]